MKNRINKPLWIMVAGPYGSGARTQKQKHDNRKRLNEAALAIFDKGHIPIVGVNNALPLIDIAGQQQFSHIMMPISIALIERCDACVRIGGPSQGADQEVETFKKAGKPVYTSLNEIPRYPG